MNQIDRCRISEGDSATAKTLACRGELALTLPLRHGGIAGISLKYELAGRPDSPLLVVAGGISAGRHVLASDAFPEPGWWQAQSRTLDTQRFQIMAIDWIGADGQADLPIDPADQADAIARLLDALGVAKVAAFIGASYGAMAGMHFAARYPDRLGRLLSISASARAHPFASACRALQRQALSLGEWNGDPESGVALARALAILTYRTPQEFAERFASAPTVCDGRVRVGAEDYLDAHGARHCRKMSSIAYRRLSESIDLHLVDPATLTVPATFAAVDQDALVPAADIEALARQVPGSRFHLIHSRFGHDAFLKEEAQVAAIITDFLEHLEKTQ
jgi:homoserine O-acetyltransferase